MTTKTSALDEIRGAKRLAERLAKDNPTAAPWPTLFSLLEFYETKVADHWPLSKSEKEACKIGWFSVRNIEEVFPDLHAALSKAAKSITHSGEL